MKAAPLKKPEREAESNDKRGRYKSPTPKQSSMEQAIK